MQGRYTALLAHRDGVGYGGQLFVLILWNKLRSGAKVLGKI